MNPFLRTTLFAALAFASVDGQAKTDKPCIATIEAHEVSAGTAKPKAGCPVAVAHLQPDAGTRKRWFAFGGSNASRRA